MTAIETNQIRKEFGDLVAVRGLTLQVDNGEVFGFLGPNGAGKTTSIKMMLGLVSPSSGSARLLDSPLGNRQTRAKIGFLPEHFRFHDWLTADEFLTYHGQLYGISPNLLKKRISELLDRVGLTTFAKKQLRTYSKGMLQRVGLAQALLNWPRLVFLDEPTSGLDPVGRRLVRDIIAELRSQGTTVFLNSHILSEIEITCDRVAFIKYGEVLRVSELKSLVAGETRVSLRTSQLSEAARQGLVNFGSDLRFDEEQSSLMIASETVLPEITRFLVSQGVDVYAITPQRVSLEELFIQIVGTDGGL
jgi:ABC-2 type transport system ATP-binding protein